MFDSSNSKLTLEDKLYAALKYLRRYPDMDGLAAEYGVCKGTVCLAIQWVEDAPAKNGAFVLPEKKAPYSEDPGRYRAEQPANHRCAGSIAIYGAGREHDFKVHKDTIGKGAGSSIPIDADWQHKKCM